MAAPELISTNDIYQSSACPRKINPRLAAAPARSSSLTAHRYPLANNALRAMTGRLVSISPSHRLPWTVEWVSAQIFPH
jgi:hypothetical protein